MTPIKVTRILARRGWFVDGGWYERFCVHAFRAESRHREFIQREGRA